MTFLLLSTSSASSVLQVWLEISHLDYCSANFLHVVGFYKFFVNILKIFVWYPALTYEVLLRYILPVNFVWCSWWRVIILFLKVRNLEEKDELVPCPGTILRAIARILIDRWKLGFYFTSNIKKGEKETWLVVSIPWRGGICSKEWLTSRKRCSPIWSQLFQAQRRLTVNWRLAVGILRHSWIFQKNFYMYLHSASKQ